MFATDPIDSILALYENPLPKSQARSDFEESLMALNDHLKNFIESHSHLVTERNQSTVIVESMSLLNLIDRYFTLTNPKTAGGN